ncbi:MAG: tRNA threonylcarbamoyladenosine dehydratase [Bacteroidales bacterium]|nr:tRNA threonylcarbamoyladenosine dehydratase [Candidatus Cacconaster equi]
MWTDRTKILVGEEGLKRLSGATVAVIGLGGVGAVAAEMTARAGVGKMMILDSDTVSDTNRNRQIIALTSTIEKKKAEIVADRLLDINPRLELIVREDYLTEENVAGIFEGLPSESLFVIDAIDTLAPKLALVKYCVDRHIPLVSSMGSGAKFDVTKIRITDISNSFNCPLAYIVRKRLRHMGISRGFKVVFSEELPDENAIVEMTPEEISQVSNKKSQVGTISYLPAAFGCACAQAAIEWILQR